MAGKSVKDVIAVCNEFIDSKLLFIDRKIAQILEAIAGNDEIYKLIGDCLADFNKDKEFEKAFTIAPSGKGTFNLPKEEVKIIAFVFCLLVDINDNNINFDDLIGKFFVDDEGRKDYKLFMQKVVVPFRDLIGEAFGVSTNVTTVEAIEEMKETDEQEEVYDEDEEESSLGQPRFKFNENVNLEKTFELARGIAEQIYYQLEAERKKTEMVIDGKDILNSVVIACDKADFETLYNLVIGLKYVLKGVKSARFLVRELVDVVKSRLY